MIPEKTKVKQRDTRPRGGWPFRKQEAGENRDSLFAAILLAFFLHLLFFWGTPSEVFQRGKPVEPVPQFMEIILEPLPEEIEVDETYVRAAPDVAELTPEETKNISDRDQQAAQEEEISLLDPENSPYVEGDMEESNRIVQGNPNQQPTAPSQPAASQSTGGSPFVQQEAAPQLRPAERNPDFLEQESEEEEGIASIEVSDKAREKPEEPQELLEEMEETSDEDGKGLAQMTTPAQASEVQTPTPRPRLRVERDTSFGPVKDNRQGVINIGRLAFDSQYSEFGEYWRRVTEIIEKRWRNLVYNTKSIPFGGNRVVVQFSITREGQVTDVKVGQSDAGKLAETVSIDAIVGEAPFFEWTPEMIVKMGEAAPCAIHFFY